jgi:hypothetical protein
MVFEFISLLLTMSALQIKCFSNSLTRNQFYIFPAFLFLKGMTGTLAPFSCLVLILISNQRKTEHWQENS